MPGIYVSKPRKEPEVKHEDYDRSALRSLERFKKVTTMAVTGTGCAGLADSFIGPYITANVSDAFLVKSLSLVLLIVSLAAGAWIGYYSDRKKPRRPL
ncbi:hypothetical protein [Chitinophaga barathri]|uniref:Uncharacterized protein n=1 Tax=Chitinophaga barathri TaxID=1647451 RepID=A0A3N4M8F3_9BACT|nr:hypothetical protein [Chitinophaga barathri]RPD39535.1 hypothetical protein EG028_20690 [Chitinophaga barathri]